MTLARRLGLVIFSIATVAGGMLVLSLSVVAHNTVLAGLELHQPDIAKQLAADIDRLLYERQKDVNAITGGASILNVISRPSNASARGAAVARLQELVAVSGSSWDNLSVVDRNGAVIASSANELIGKAFTDDAAIEDIIHQAQSGQPAYSDLVIGKRTGQPTVIFASPVRQEDNPGKPVIATVVGSFSWGAVIDLLKSASAPVATVYNHAGKVIANKENPGAILKEDHSNDQAVVLAQGQASGTQVLPGSKDGSPAVIAYTYEPGYSDFKGNGWVVTLEMPASVAFAPANDATIKLTAIAVLVIGVGSVLSILLILRAVRPVTQLTKSANRLAIGDLSHRFKVTTKDEFGQLGTALNNMADKLQQLYQGLEGKVKEKTVRLALRAQEAEASAAKDEAILSSIGEGLVVVNNDGRVIRINAQALEIFGIKLEDVLGRKILENVQFAGDRGEPLDEGDLPSQSALAKGERSIGTYLIKRGTEKVLVAIIANPVQLKDQIVGAIMVVRDVTKEREVDRMKTEFISLASHQLRTPLSAIKWFTEMLVAGDAGPLNEEQHEFASNVYDSTQRMIELVNALLNISRIESGRIIVDPHPTDVSKMVHGIVNDLKAKIEEKHQSLSVSVHEDLPQINLDSRLIGQVYLNFLTNAIKYTPEGGEISVTVSRKGEELVSQISDNGYGIPADQQSRVFQKFFRAENAVKVETDGTGLGLYLVKAIIESSGGRVWFKSVENKGTTFWFSLPMSGMKAHEGEVTLDV